MKSIVQSGQHLKRCYGFVCPKK